MGLAYKEPRYHWRKNALIATIVVLMMFLVLSLTGLVKGLGRAVSSGIETMEAPSFVLSDDAETILTVSSVSSSQVEQLTEQIDAQTTTLDVVRLHVELPGTVDKSDAVLFAVDPDDFLAPRVHEGQTLAQTRATNPVVLDDDFQASGVAIGDVVTDSATGTALTVVGFASDQMYGHVSAGFIRPDTYALIMQRINPGYERTHHAVAVNLPVDSVEVDGLAVYTKAEVIEAIPGYKAEQTTITMVIWMLVIITAFIIGIFFYVINLQKEKEFGVMKAIGTDMSTLVRFILSQVLLISVSGAAAVLLTNAALSLILPTTMPFHLDWAQMVLVLAAFIAVSVLGGLVSAHRVWRIDPVRIIGGDN